MPALRGRLVATVALLAALLPGGCGRRPRAPALQDGAVYQNEREGFRFVAPDGWAQQAKADVPPGPAAKERLLVLYRAYSVNPPASLTVSLADLPETTDLAEHLATPSAGVNWQVKAGPEPLDVHGVAARRYELNGTDAQKRAMAREVVAFRRGGRTYFFTSTFAASDHARREQARQAVHSVLWSR